MNDIISRQVIIISINCENFHIDPVTFAGTPSIINVPINLRFAANELSTTFNCVWVGHGGVDTDDVIQIYCSITNDNIIGAFPNGSQSSILPNQQFSLNNTYFQTGTMTLQLQQTDNANPFSYNPQPLISSQDPQRTSGVVVLTFEFLKVSKLLI